MKTFQLKWHLSDQKLILKCVTFVIYCDKACINDKSDILCTFMFIYIAVQKSVFTWLKKAWEERTRTLVSISRYYYYIIILYYYIIEEFHSRGITCYDYITSPHGSFSFTFFFFFLSLLTSFLYVHYISQIYGHVSCCPFGGQNYIFKPVRWCLLRKRGMFLHSTWSLFMKT